MVGALRSVGGIDPGWRVKNVREIQGEPDLAAYPGTRYVSAAERTETETQAVPKRILASEQSLELALGQIPVVRVSPVNLAPQREPCGEVVQDRHAAGINVTARVAYAHDSRAGVAGEQVSEIGVDPSLVGEGFLGDQVQPVVRQA